MENQSQSVILDKKDNIIENLANDFISFAKNEYKNNSLLLRYIKNKDYSEILGEFLSTYDKRIEYHIFKTIDLDSFCKYCLLHWFQSIEPFVHNP